MPISPRLDKFLHNRLPIDPDEEALVQILQPSLFASRINQVSLQHIADVSVQQDFIGTVLGYGQIVLETPGEQNNYQFIMLPDPHRVAREVIQAHESFDAALQGGRIATRMTSAMPAAPRIDPQQYQEFLQYQQMVRQQHAEQTANDPNSPASQQPQNPIQPQ
jgi:hypothetical protein